MTPEFADSTREQPASQNFIPKEDPRLWPLCYQLLLWLGGITALVGSVATVSIYNLEYRYLSRELNRNIHQSLTLLGATAIDPLLLKDAALLQTIVDEAASSYEELVSLSILDSSGNVLAHKLRVDTQQSKHSELYSQPVIFENREFGTIRAVINFEPLLADVRQHTISIALALLGILALLALVGAFLLYKLIFTPLKEIAAFTQEPAPNKINREQKYRTRELDLLNNSVIGQKITEQKLSSALKKTQAATNAKSTFLANMSHEIRTPMNGIIGMTELLSETPLTLEQNECLEIVHSSAEALLGVINDVLDFSKIEAGKMDIVARPFAVRNEMSVLAGMFGLSMTQKELNFVISLDDAVPDGLIGDWPRIRQILINLVQNAHKFTSVGGSVSVQVIGSAEPANDPNSRVLEFKVRDTGIGISPERHSSIFAAFTQVDASLTRRYGGTGLGLSISQNLARLMGGEIAMESTVNKGSTFTLRVPLEIDSKYVAPERTTHSKSWHGSLTQLSVLVVEDNLVNQKVLHAILAKAGATITAASNGLEALEKFSNQTFDVILMDIQMPEMGGVEATREIRANENPRGKVQPIIAITAHALQGDKEHYLAQGMDGYITKPVNCELLVETILNCLPENDKQTTSKEQNFYQKIPDS